jgi:hypothetical protein
MLQASDDLLHWTDVSSGVVIGDASYLLDSTAGTRFKRFYRAAPPE